MKVIYQDENVRVVDKPAGVTMDSFEKPAHRLDKDTSGVLLLAKNDEALKFLQKQFQERKVKKQYLTLVVGNLKEKKGKIETLLGRSPKDRRKQKVYLPNDPQAEGKRESVTNYQVLQKFENYDLIEVEPQTGRKHQIRAHFAHLGHPVAGDKLYGFKNRAFQRKAKVKMKRSFIDNQPCHIELRRQFLHATYLKIKLPTGETKEFKSNLPKDLNLCLQKLTPSSKTS